MALEIECDQMVKPFVGSSALAGRNCGSPASRNVNKPGNLSQLIDISAESSDKKAPVKRSLNISLNESSLSRGGGIASKIGLAMSRIVQSGQNERLEDDEEIRDLINLIEDLNSHSDLTEKLTHQSKISLFLQKVGAQSNAGQPVKKDYRAQVSDAKQQFGGLQSKLRLEMKALMFDPQVKEIVDASRNNLEKLHKERDAEMKQFEAEQTKIKVEKIAQVEKLFKLKIKLAEKADDSAKMQQVMEQKNAAMDKAGAEFMESKEEEAAKIKAKYDELAKNIKIDSKSLISALLRKKEVSFPIIL